MWARRRARSYATRAARAAARVRARRGIFSVLSASLTGGGRPDVCRSPVGVASWGKNCAPNGLDV
jgi:hypothetical protein